MPYKDKVLQKEAVKKAVHRHRVLQEGITEEGITSGITTNNVIPLYDHDLTVEEVQTLHGQRSEDQVDRFPDIPLPFGEAYHIALEEQLT